MAGESPAEAGNGGAPAGGHGGESLLAAGASGTPVDTGGGGVGGEGPAISLPESGTGGLAGSSAGRGSVTAGSGGMAVSALSSTSCQVTADPRHESRPLAQCLPAGGRKESESCFSGADCEAGLACVGDGPGQCRKYCCSGEDSCGLHTQCAVESLVPPADGRDPFARARLHAGRRPAASRNRIPARTGYLQLPNRQRLRRRFRATARRAASPSASFR